MKKILLTLAVAVSVGSFTVTASAGDLSAGDQNSLATISQKALGAKPADALFYNASVTKALGEVPESRGDCTIVKKVPNVVNGRIVGYFQRRQCPHIQH